LNPDVEFPILVSPMAGFPGRCFGGRGPFVARFGYGEEDPFGCWS